MGAKAVVIAILAVVVGCAPATTVGTPASTPRDVATQAAMIRWLIENNDSALGGSASAYCVGVGTGLLTTEPSPALIRELAGGFPRVQPVSRCRWARDAAVGRRVVDELSGAPALALFVGLPEYEGEDAARIWAEYVERPGLGSGYDCRLARGPEGWRVTDCRRGFPR